MYHDEEFIIYAYFIWKNCSAGQSVQVKAIFDFVERGAFVFNFSNISYYELINADQF